MSGESTPLSLEDLDRFFGYWDHDGGSRKEAAADDAYVPKLKGELRDELDNVRRSFGQYSRHSATFEFEGFRFLATGAMSCSKRRPRRTRTACTRHRSGGMNSPPTPRIRRRMSSRAT